MTPGEVLPRLAHLAAAQVGGMSRRTNIFKVLAPRIWIAFQNTLMNVTIRLNLDVADDRERDSISLFLTYLFARRQGKFEVRFRSAIPGGCAFGTELPVGSHGIHED